MEGVLLLEADGGVAFQGEEVGEEEVDELGAGRVVEEEGCFWVFDGLGLAGFEGAGGAGGAWFAGGWSVDG